jgi:four helix bundle protein
MMAIRQYSELIVWQKAMDLAESVYTATARFPREEQFGLTNQLRRAAVSVPSNIAEGQGRRSTNEFLQHLSIARGSLQEAQTQVLLAGRLSYLGSPDVTEIMNLASEVAKLLNGLTNALTKGSG